MLASFAVPIVIARLKGVNDEVSDLQFNHCPTGPRKAGSRRQARSWQLP